MATYNLHYTGEMATLQSVYFYENISSAIESDSLIDSGTPGSVDNQTILMYIRGRKTNWIRGVCAIGTVSNGTYRPTYQHNSRYWELKLLFYYPTSSNITTYDIYNGRRLGVFVAPVNETYDITLTYGAQDVRNDVNIVQGRVINGIDIVLNVTVDETFTNIEANSPISYYTEYNKNDLSAKNTGAFVSTDDRGNEGGLPVEGAACADQIIDIQTNVQYGVQTWVPDQGN